MEIGAGTDKKEDNHYGQVEVEESAKLATTLEHLIITERVDTHHLFNLLHMTVQRPL